MIDFLKRLLQRRGRPGPGRIFITAGFFGACHNRPANHRAHQSEWTLGHCCHFAEYGKYGRGELTNPGPRAFMLFAALFLLGKKEIE